MGSGRSGRPAAVPPLLALTLILMLGMVGAAQPSVRLVSRVTLSHGAQVGVAVRLRPVAAHRQWVPKDLAPGPVGGGSGGGGSPAPSPVHHDTSSSSPSSGGGNPPGVGQGQ